MRESARTGARESGSRESDKGERIMYHWWGRCSMPQGVRGLHVAVCVQPLQVSHDALLHRCCRSDMHRVQKRRE
jgi:hypothetical protein